jgi:hypothetical protein
MQASVSVPYPKEFRTVRDNRALLEQIADKTGGRVLAMTAATDSIDAFLRDNLPIPESARRMWDLMAILAAVFFLLDVAVRRVAIDWAGARSGVAGAVAVRKVGDGTVEAWKKARSKSGARGGAAGEAPATSDAMRDTLERGPGLDVRGAVKEGGTAPAPEAPRKPKADEPAAGGDEETTSRLLRAKRRATGDGGGDAADGKGGGGGG